MRLYECLLQLENVNLHFRRDTKLADQCENRIARGGGNVDVSNLAPIDWNNEYTPTQFEVGKG